MIADDKAGIFYENLLRDGVHQLMQLTGQAMEVPPGREEELLGETLISVWKQISGRKTGTEDAGVIFLATFQKICTDKFGRQGAYTLSAYPSEGTLEAVMRLWLKTVRKAPMLKGEVMAFPALRIFRILSIVLSVAVLGLSLLSAYFYMNWQQSLEENRLLDENVKNLSADYAKVYSAYYQLEDKLFQITSRASRRFSMNDTVRKIGAEALWFADNGEVMLSVDSLPPLCEGCSYVLRARNREGLQDLGSFQHSIRAYENGHFEDVMHASAFFIVLVDSTSEEVLLKSE